MITQDKLLNLFNKKSLYLGCYKDLELAELVAVEAKNKYHKEFANYGR